MSWRSECHSCLLCPRLVLVHLKAFWLPVSSPGCLHSKWKCLMPIRRTEFNQDSKSHVTFIFMSLFFLKLLPIASCLPVSALQGWAPFPGSSRQ